MSPLIKIGLIINPICGMGGAVGLKGTDGKDILEKARSLGASPQAPQRTYLFLEHLKSIMPQILFITPPEIMGEEFVRSAGFKYQIIDKSLFPHAIEIFKTTAQDTIISAKKLLEEKVKILIFVGGDGTAKDIFNVVGQNIPCLGIPGGVKIHSSVFAVNPESAANLVIGYLSGKYSVRESEVLDIDEEEFRNNRVVSKLFGYMMTPYEQHFIQGPKGSSPTSEDEESNKDSIAEWIIQEMSDEFYYLIGPGTTTKRIADLLNEPKTLLGVDLMYKKKMIAFDLNEQQILKEINNHPIKLIVTPIGNQGFLFGRGNLQLSGKVLKRIGFNNIIIVCTKYKLSTLPDNKMRTDSRDPELDEQIKGLYKVLVDYAEYRIISIE